jgi:predicted DsbA family dithiol-disulfide isomerase
MAAAPPVRPAPGTIAVYSDIGCPWARLCVHRLHRIRRERGLLEVLRVEHRAFPLEVVNGRPTPKRKLDAEVAVIAGTDADVPWRMWHAPPETYPVSTLLAMEAVQATAAAQGWDAAERLDLALRDAFFVESRCISVPAVVLEVARRVPGVDVAGVESALRSGAHRGAVSRVPDNVTGSPHLFLAGGGHAFNPGIEMEQLRGDLVALRADGGVASLSALVERAAAEIREGRPA